MVSDDRRLAEACGSADIVLSTVDAQGRCRGPRLVIDRRDAWRDGAHALWLDEAAYAARPPTPRAATGRGYPTARRVKPLVVKAPGA
jgi:competence protein ComEC